jgi:hypothetical protein
MSTLALRRTVFLDGERQPDDYEVRHEGPDRWPHSPYAQHRPTGGLADSLDEAKAAFRMASDAGGLDRSECARPKAGQRPLSPEIADEKCSLRAFLFMTQAV